MTDTALSVRALARRALGRPADWGFRRPAVPTSRPSSTWLGAAMVAASVLAGWFAFTGANGDEGNVQYGLFVGAASIVLMAWSFVLALRPRLLEPLFGGLDRMYRAHRWSGTLAVLAMFLHTQAEPEIDGGVRGAAKSVANSAEDLAGVGEIMLYVLVGISLLRWFPYRYWRWTHKLLGVPFVFACWHFFTAEKTYANNSPWGWWFGGIMIAGIVAYVLRVIGRDMIAPGRRHVITSVERSGSTTALTLRPVNRAIEHRAGQFAVLKLRTRGMTEPHVFTIASSPEADELVFHIRDLGDWSHRLQQTDMLGEEAVVEGPYGHFRPGGLGAPTVWVAGGVGITPFLSALATCEPAPPEERPTLIYCVRDRASATAIDELEQANAAGRLRLEVFASNEGRRFKAAELTETVGRASLAGVHVAVCGPMSLVRDVSAAARRAGATTVETEDFDIRGGFGPDLSTTVEEMVSRFRS